MHIVILENHPSSRRGGQELSLLDTSRGLAALGHEITLLYTAEGNLLAQYSTFCKRLIKVNHYRFDAKRPVFSFSKLLPDLWKTVVEKADIVYCNQYHDSFFGYVASQLKRVPFVCHLRLPPPPVLGWQWQLGMQGATRLIAVSNHTKKEWVQLGYPYDSIDVVYNGIDETIFLPAATVSTPRVKLNISDTDLLISYVGRLDKNKGLETLLKGFAKLRETNDMAHLVIAGKPLNDNATYLSTLKALVAGLNISTNVTFLGHIDQPIQVYQASDLVVLPSEWPEPFGRTIIEALSCGVPVVGSNIGGIPEVLTNQFSQCLFESANPQSLSKKLRQHIDWRTHTPGLGNQCRNHVLAQFCLSSAIKRVEKTLLTAINA